MLTTIKFDSEKLKEQFRAFNAAKEERQLYPILQILKNKFLEKLQENPELFGIKNFYKICPDKFKNWFQEFYIAELFEGGDVQIIFVLDDVDFRDYNGPCMMAKELRFSGKNGAVFGFIGCFQKFLINQDPEELKREAAQLLMNQKMNYIYWDIRNFYSNSLPKTQLQTR